MTQELSYLFGGGVIMFAIIIIQVAYLPLSKGLAWGLSARDEAVDGNVLDGRIARTLNNHIESMVLFATAVLVAHAAGISTEMTALGAMLYFWARLIYVPIYLLGLPYLRTISFLTGAIGTVLIYWEIAAAINA